MGDLPRLSEAVIRRHASSRSYQRGADYYERGAVLSLLRRGDQVLAAVEGSQYEPYRVRITLGPGGVVAADCTCPYDWGGWCKHIVAAALACVRSPEEVQERPSVESLLAGLEGEQLQELVLYLVRRQPALADLVDVYVQGLQLPSAQDVAVSGESPPPPRARRTPVDTTAYRRQVRAILRSLDRMDRSEAYWHVGEVVEQVGGVLAIAQGFTEAGDGRNALHILEAITEEYMAGWLDLDDSDGAASAFFAGLGVAWTEALLSADLADEERQAWADRLTQWQGDIDDYGVDEAFDAAIAAAEQGWEYPALVRVLQGEITNKGAWPGEAPSFADNLAVARLNVLARQGRYQEYLYLAEAEGQDTRYVTMLVQLDRIQEALDYGLHYLGTAGQALALAQALHERGALQEALRIAEHGLTLQGHKAALADWMAQLAAAVGEAGRALQATIVSFRDSPTLITYLQARDLAGERWPEVQPGLLAHLAEAGQASNQVDIYLHEGMVAEAVGAVDAHSYVGYDALERVVDAALETFPDWAIRRCRAQAEPIMDRGEADKYHHAARWLDRARAAYRVAGREVEWKAYLDTLLDRHRRKYKLVPMLRALK